MEKIYQNMLSFINKRPNLKTIIKLIAKYFPYIMFITYPIMIIYCYLYKNNLLLVTIIKPLSAFFIVTIIRKIINRKRPYETMNIQSLSSHKTGESFPSRHSVSAMIIALTLFNINQPLGIIYIIIASIICLTRILCALHYPSDVISAIIIALIINYL